jgi:DNA-binding MarR family transcriptional regulator
MNVLGFAWELAKMSEFFQSDPNIAVEGNYDPLSSVSAMRSQTPQQAFAVVSRVEPSTTSPQFVRKLIAARASRRHFFSAELFADPAWDILLELYALHCEQRRISISKLCLAAAVPSTTALRWLDKLQADGTIMRAADPLDSRRVRVSLSPAAVEAMKSYLRELAGTYLLEQIPL